MVIHVFFAYFWVKEINLESNLKFSIKGFHVMKFWLKTYILHLIFIVTCNHLNNDYEFIIMYF